MQRPGCEDVQLLISKYIDGEATPAEREIVDLHIVACRDCARKMTEYMEFAAIFAEAPMRAPQPELRAGLFREIGSMKEEAARKDAAISRRRGLSKWVPPSLAGGSRRRSDWERLWDLASPFAALSLAVFAIIAVIFVNAGQQTRVLEPVRQAFNQEPISTVPATFVYPYELPGSESTNPPAISTGLASPPPVASVGVMAQRTATIDGAIALQLERAVPVEEGTEAWHELRDPAYGYLVSYPANWWTQSMGSTRSFFKWSEGGTRYAPYWIELSVQNNTQRLNVSTGNQQLLAGKGSPEGLWLRYIDGIDEGDIESTDELYAFDANFIYKLSLVVPKDSPLGSFDGRWSEAQQVFSQMSRRMSIGGQAGRVLFLNGGDLWSVSASGPANPSVVWSGQDRRWTRQVALSPNGRTVAFATTGDPTDIWADELHLGQVDSTVDALSLLSGAEIHDIAWYSDLELLVLAALNGDGLGIYRLKLEGASAPSPELVLALGDDMVGARGLAVSPDRQLISFMAPLGDNRSTDIYGVRPDGSNLLKLVEHADATSPSMATGQAIKSYVWVDGRLEPGQEQGGYVFNVLYTRGNSLSPTLYRGGHLYSAPRPGGGPLLDPALLEKPDAASVQMVHLAYSPAGKVAMSGFYTLRDLKVESLAGLWTADLKGGALSNVQPLLADATQGVSDLQWSPDGQSVIYREIVPSGETDFASRYDGRSAFSIVKLNVSSGEKTVLYRSGGG